METSKNTPKKSKIIDPFHGGRNLEAIYAMDDIAGIETAVMIFLGSQLNFKDFLHSKVTISVNQISQSIKFKKTAIKEAIKNLIDKNYLYVENNFDARGFKIENTYSLTDYLFICYVEKKQRQVVDSRQTAIDGRETASNLPLIRNSDFVPDFEEEKEKENNDIYIKTVRSGGVAEPLSPQQTDIEERTDSPTAKTAHGIKGFDSDLDDGFKERKPIVNSKDQFKSKVQKTKEEHPEYILPIVTQSHRKMIAIFRITDPDLKRKSFVLDNDIHAFTDQILSKYGRLGHNVIDLLYSDMVELKKCGKIAWDINKAFQRLDIAYKKLLKKSEDEENE
jgi:hypothetical protein